MKFSKKKARKIKFLVLDVDGVLTNGQIVLDHMGKEIKMFSVQDGFGIVLWRRLGYEVAIITAKSSEAVAWRAKDLGIDCVYQNAHPKLDAYEELLKKYHINDSQVCFIGDDLPDMAILKRVGLPVTVPAGRAEIKKIASYVTKNEGGFGAVREVIELILKSQNKWEEMVARYE